MQLGCSGIISATCNVTAKISRKVYDDFYLGKEPSHSQKLHDVRGAFDKFTTLYSHFTHTLLA